MGKTTLALALSHRAREADLVGHALFCDLSAAWSLDDIVTAMSHSLGAHQSAGDAGTSSVERLGHALAGRGSILVVLDNFEQVVEHAAQTVRVWMEQAPEATFLVTSRDRLRLRGEAVLELAPLESEDGVALFLAAAEEHRPDLALGEVELAAVARLVTRLDGIPLAIELAAARVRVMSPSRMLDRIDKRFSLLGHGPSDSVPRQATLEAAIEWSWNLLDEGERAVLAQCAVFRGGFTLEQAEAIVQVEGVDVLDALASLGEKSLLRSGGSAEVRFATYESVRDFAEPHAPAATAARNISPVESCTIL